MLKIVYNSFGGWFSDSPRALHRAVAQAHDGEDVEHVWIASPEQARTFPDGVTTVVHGTPECVAALETADLVVSNTHLGMQWRKGADTVYLQTWHGTPLKVISHDEKSLSDDVRASIDEDVSRWDLLLSPNAASTPHLRRAFRWAGAVHETGLPRNDVLSAPDRDLHRARVRSELGIEEGTTAVLYTPTWRDDDLAEDGADFRLRVDLARFRERLGDRAVLLLRLHYKISDALGAVTTPGVLDLSAYPDVADLYLAADVMVTDYSSTQFDFAGLGRPIVHLADDLERYEAERGMYYDYRQLCPGPIVSSSEQLLDALADLDGVRRRTGTPLAAFADMFCSLDDGHATERVLDLVLPRIHGEDELSRRSA